MYIRTINVYFLFNFCGPMEQLFGYMFLQKVTSTMGANDSLHESLFIGVVLCK